MLRIGIECESIEDLQTWGVGRILKSLLKKIAENRDDLREKYRFILYFKSHVPDFDFLKDPIFEKHLLTSWILPRSFSFYYYLRLPWQLWRDKPDLIYLPNYMLPFFVTSRSLVVLTEDVYYEINRGSLPWRYKLAYRIFSGHAARAATRILAISESSKKNVARLFKINPDRISVNHLGVDIVNHSHSEIREGGKYVLYVGQAFPRRHLKETILAFSQIASEFPEINFIAVGRDKYNPPQIIDLIKEENVKLGGERIRHYDYISESQLLSLYKNAICLVYVSSEEAFGLPPLEALGYGTPPVVTDSELTRELLGNNAIFVSCPDSPQEIANALRLAIKDGKRREEISKQGRLTIDRFTWQNHFLKFKKVVEDVINI